MQYAKKQIRVISVRMSGAWDGKGPRGGWREKDSDDAIFQLDEYPSE